MTGDQFNRLFQPFYAEFGYKSSGMVPKDMGMGRFNMNSTKSLDDLGEVLWEHATTITYFVSLFWRTFKVGDFRCSEAEYTKQQLPQSVVNAAKTYVPPQLPGSRS